MYSNTVMVHHLGLTSSSSNKRKKTSTLKKQNTDEPPKRIQMKPSTCASTIPEGELNDFVTNSTTSTKHTLGLNADFLAYENPDRLQTLEDFQLNKKYANS